MTVWTRGTFSVAGFAATAVLLAGCASSPAPLNTLQAPQQLQPVANSTVSTNTLPAIGATGAPAPGLSGQPVLGGVPAGATSLPPIGTTTQTAATAGGLVSLDPLAAPVIGGGPEGVWTVLSGAIQCRLNLPMTAKTGTTRFRASAPGCTLPGLAGAASWQQVGNQVQIFDESNNLVAAVAQSGSGYIGTTSGGQGISLTR